MSKKNIGKPTHSKAKKSMAKVDGQAKKKRVRKGYQYIVKVLNKYYGYGGFKRFETLKDLKDFASVLNNKFKEEKSRVTVRNIRAEVKEKIAPRRRTKKDKTSDEEAPQVSILLQVEKAPYWYLTPRPFDTSGNPTNGASSGIAFSPRNIRFVSPMILGDKTIKGADVMVDRFSGSGRDNEYSYEGTFKPFVDYMNDLNDNRSFYDEISIRFLYENMRLAKDGMWECELISCDEYGTRTDFGFDPRNPDQKASEEIKDSLDRKERLPEVPEVPEEKEKEIKEEEKLIRKLPEIEADDIKRSKLNILYERKADISKMIELYAKIGKEDRLEKELDKIDAIEVEIERILKS